MVVPSLGMDVEFDGTTWMVVYRGVAYFGDTWIEAYWAAYKSGNR